MRIPLLLIVCILALGLAAPAWAGEATSPAGHLVRWDEGLEAVGREVLSRLPRIQSEVAKRLGFPLQGGPATVVVARGLDEMRRATRQQVPDWAAGVCVGARSLIVLRADRTTPPTPSRSITTVLRHEWVHLAWARKAGGHARRLPLWAEEGLAEEIGGGVSVDAGADLDYAAAWGRLIPWSEIRSRFPAGAGRAGLAYRQGASWIRFFIESEGWEGLRGVLDDLAAGRGTTVDRLGRTPFDQVLADRTDRDLATWTSTWRTHLEQDARPWFHLLGHDIGWTLIILLSVVSLWLYLALRRKRRRAIEALPDG